MRGAGRLGVVAAVLLLGVGVGEATQVAAQRPPAPALVPVVAATAVCPDAPLTAGAAGRGAGTLVAERSVAGAVGSDPAPAPLLPAAGEVVRDVDAAAVTATGAVAAGLAVEHVRSVEAGPVRGLLAVRCSAPTTSAWFVGGGTTVGETTELVLVNREASPAVVDVRAWSATGPTDPRPGRALRIPPRGRLVVPLDRLAPDRDLLALQMTASRGRVVPFLRHVRADGRTPQGVAQVPAVAGPSRDVVVPGLPAGPGRRTVVVVNPGERDRDVRLQLTTADGQLPVVELDVPAGTSVAHEVTDELARTPAAARVTSPDGPVLAAALVEDGAGAQRDLAWSGAAPALTGDALLPDVPPPGEQALLLTALEQDAVVDLVPAGASGPALGSAGRRVVVPGATTVTVDLPLVGAGGLEPGSAPAPGGALEVRPVRGAVHAARVLRDGTGPGVAVLPVVSPPRQLRRPAVVADPLLDR